MADEIILHQYDASPFSEKVRVVFGIKNITWRSCIQPVIMPKPELITLTGGYRKIPVMQIGADIWCDSRGIINELERRFPSPKGKGLASLGLGLGNALTVWSDRSLFGLTLPVIFGAGTNAALGGDPAFAEAFAKDRAELSGGNMAWAPEQMAAAIPLSKVALRAHLHDIETQLSDGRKFLAGDEPSLADSAVYYILDFVGFVTGDKPVFSDHKNIQAWRARIKAIGHGKRSEISREETIAIATAAKPMAPLPSVEDDPLGFKIGQRVVVAADDYGRNPMEGELTSLGIDHVTIVRKDAKAGEIALHFPRFGFTIQAA
jgi:glutathione S-transferase